MSGNVWWDMRALEALIRDWLSKPRKLQSSRAAKDREGLGVLGQQKASVRGRP
jgi:hypothetical protein